MAAKKRSSPTLDDNNGSTPLPKVGMLYGLEHYLSLTVVKTLSLVFDVVSTLVDALFQETPLVKVTPSLPKSRHSKEGRAKLKMMKEEQKAQREREKAERERERAEKKAQKESEREAKKQEKEKELKEKREKQEQREAEKRKKLEDNQLRCLVPTMSL